MIQVKEILLVHPLTLNIVLLPHLYYHYLLIAEPLPLYNLIPLMVSIILMTTILWGELSNKLGSLG